MGVSTVNTPLSPLPGLTLKAWALFDTQTYALLNSSGFSGLAMGGFAYDYVFTFQSALASVNYEVIFPFPMILQNANVGNFGYSFNTKAVGSFSVRMMLNTVGTQFTGPLYLAVYQ